MSNDFMMSNTLNESRFVIYVNREERFETKLLNNTKAILTAASTAGWPVCLCVCVSVYVCECVSEHVMALRC